MCLFQVQCQLINNIIIWGSSDVYFHVEVDKPLVKERPEEEKKDCNIVSAPLPLSVPADLDHTEFSDAWLKQEYIKNVSKYVNRGKPATIR